MSIASKVALYSDNSHAWGLIEADELMLLAKLPDACVDAIVTDPPYGIDFGDEAWDGADIRRVARLDGERLHANEAFERWTAVWAAQAMRVLKPGGHLLAFGAPRTFHRLVCGVEDAGLEIRDQLLWLYAQGLPKSRRMPEGLATTLKPAYEPILLARKRLFGAVIGNVKVWGTGALNTDAARVGGYWPAHLALSHAGGCSEAGCASDCPVRLIDAARPDLRPSRLFFCAKASRREKEAGCEQLPARSVKLYNGGCHPPRVRHNTHRTVKPIALMRWLVALVTPPGGVVLDPFAGSGTTGIAAVLEGRLFLGVEREPEYIDIACARLTHWAHEVERESS
ncbi:MAG TPA: site-specific DNA-methyltransferase [Solirubrobacteraceae bacterium]|nr:site-specific DNA-methyltransferase [Solirubrobacteraceae bacterium]